ncbi:hypothetical protein A3A38_02065 [Candidatus Kaiserbacteria bacterium RIFCSPLOWO2_01_FULL_53_17]|uniref:Uncharacterized protein n=1 Tax=Candidatus Kaiserbacteria bacterium RIFCSPLOWO2_01_FULL_53_17 TaxID=1798511 RepID=A0A1F6EFM1_9BACT|nr:MAG: hypothetical protein A3A38_02065 [Candidatus Kaiserbacteria bacterium RIFCSPLOWO2_01_FULL_53_17]
MFQRLTERVGQWLHQSQPRPSYPTATGVAVDWAPIIWAYSRSLWRGGWSPKNSDRVDKECRSRGLAFGQVRVEATESNGGVTLRLLGGQKITAEQARGALRQAITEAGLVDRLALQDGFSADEIEANFTRIDDPLPGCGWCKFRGGRSFSGREFLSVSCWGGSGLHEMKAHSIEALRVLIRVAELLGFPAGPKHYAHESPVKIEDIIVYAVRWQDPRSGARYLDVLWRPELVKHQIWHGGGRSDKRTEGAYKGEVFASTSNTSNGDSWPRMTINNRPVYSTIVENPTDPMRATKERFAKESVHVCRYCGKFATLEFMHVNFEHTDSCGSSSMGGISYTCNSPACIDKAKGEKCVRTTEHPYLPEMWTGEPSPAFREPPEQR